MNNPYITNADLNELKKQYQGEELDIVLNKIKNGYPVSYLIGYVNFCGNKIIVNNNVLIPRYETEFLVDLISKKLPDNFSGRFIDIGTGSGCIAISLSKIFSKSSIVGIDISEGAINVANENRKLNSSENTQFQVNDIFEFENLDGFDIVVSNPPYVSHNEPVGKQTKYEPQNAIFAPNEGLVFYEKIIKLIANSKQKPKYIFFEIGMMQAEKISSYIKDIIPDYSYEIIKDLAGKDRYVFISLNN